jgi:hypothetical protein
VNVPLAVNVWITKPLISVIVPPEALMGEGIVKPLGPTP